MLPLTKPAVRPAGFSPVKSIVLPLAWKHCETKNGKDYRDFMPLDFIMA